MRVLLGLAIGVVVVVGSSVGYANCPLTMHGVSLEWDVSYDTGRTEQWFEYLRVAGPREGATYWLSELFDEEGQLRQILGYACNDGELFLRDIWWDGVRTQLAVPVVVLGSAVGLAHFAGALAETTSSGSTRRVVTGVRQTHPIELVPTPAGSFYSVLIENRLRLYDVDGALGATHYFGHRWGRSPSLIPVWRSWSDGGHSYSMSLLSFRASNPY